ncbi:MAG: energy-dependent translational throttle protein EttA [Acidobacteriota bacterium]
MPEIIYTMKGLGKVYPPQRTVFSDLWLSFWWGAKIGVIGANGSGKSTLLRIMAGVDREYLGEAFADARARVGYLPQEPVLDESATVGEEIDRGIASTRALLEQFDALSERLAEPMSDEAMAALLDEQAALQDRIDAAGAWDLDAQLQMAADALRCPEFDTPVRVLSGGERRRVALCRLLLEHPDLLLLDEPTNHLDAETVAWLEHYLHGYKGTVVAVTHDRYFLDNVAGWMLELDRGRGIPWEGNYSSWLEQKKLRLEQEGRARDARRRTLERELEWIRMTPPARQTRSKARIRAWEKLAAEEEQRLPESVEIFIAPGPRLGDRVIEAEGLAKGYGDRLLFDDLSFIVPRGAIVGIVGPNGAGKTTLFRLITGEEQPDAGQLALGETVRLAAVDQSRSVLADDASVFEAITEGQDPLRFGRREVNARAYVASFGFKGTDQQKKVGVLSGGERNRVHLARVLKAGGNVLLLDEPTNDLDVDTLRALEEAILGFSGCVLVISHDRWFLDRIATHVLAFEGESRVTWFEGSWQDYAADRRRRLGDERPHRIRYRKFAR